MNKTKLHCFQNLLVQQVQDYIKCFTHSEQSWIFICKYFGTLYQNYVNVPVLICFPARDPFSSFPLKFPDFLSELYREVQCLLDTSEPELVYLYSEVFRSGTRCWTVASDGWSVGRAISINSYPFLHYRQKTDLNIKSRNLFWQLKKFTLQ